LNTSGKWGRRRAKIGNKTYYPYIFCDGVLKSVVGYIFENPKYFITSDNFVLKTSDNEYFRVFNNVDILITEEGNIAIAGISIVGQTIVGKEE
jgi:hypothetical protein